MAINNTSRRNDYTGNGALTTYPYTFKIFADTDLEVYEDNVLVDSANYTVSDAGDIDGGNVVFDTAPANGVAVALVSNVPAARTVDYQQAGAFPATQVNADFDKLYAKVREIIDVRDRSIRLADDDLAADLVLPLEAARATKYLAFDSNGDLIATTAVGTWKGTWTTATSYALGDVVSDGVNGAETLNLYVNQTDHTSGTWATDLAASKWALVIDVEAALTSLGEHTLYISSLLDDANAAEARTTLGLGTAAVLNTGVSSGNVPLVGTASATDVLAGLVEKATTAEAQAGTEANKFPDVVGVAAAILAQTSFAVGTVSRDATAASGNVAYTGVGFQPRLMIFFAAVHTGLSPSFGADDGTTSFVVYDRGNITVNQWGTITGHSIRFEPTTSNFQLGEVASMDADGFTLAWAKGGSPTGTISVNYIALR